MMGTWFKGRQVWLYQKHVDFRKQLDGTVYIFRNRQTDKLNLLVWDRNGYFMGYKRLEKGRFDFPLDEEGQAKLSFNELEMLISGMPIVRMKKMTENRNHLGYLKKRFNIPRNYTLLKLLLEKKPL
jgi:transposase